MAANQNPSQCVLRIVHVNDVYILTHLPKLKTVLDRQRAKPGTTICTLAGDFIMPSVLSGLDKGAGMIDVLNGLGMDFVCFGNHECDIPNSALIDRIKESKFKWINSNMRDFQHPCPEYEIVQVSSADGTHSRKIALLGVCIPVTKKKFGGAGATMEDPNTCVARLGNVLKRAKGIDAVIPLTHQDQADDEALAAMSTTLEFDLPVVLGGHDHDENYVQKGSSWVIKAGDNALKACVMEITWDSADQTKSSFTYEVLDVTAEQPDQDLQVRVDKHMVKVLAMEHLFLSGPGGTVMLNGEIVVLSSERVRFQPTTVGTFFAKAVRTMMKTDCCLLEAANIKGESNYAGKLFNMAALRNELPFDSEVVSVHWTGRMIKAVIEESRAYPGQEAVFYQQVDDGIKFDATGHVTHIANAPIELAKEYTCAVFWGATFLFKGNRVIEQWRDDPANAVHLIPSPEKEGMPIKVLLMEYFARSLWQKLPWFDEIDKDHEGTLSFEEVKAAYIKAFAAQYLADGKCDDAEIEAIDAAVRLLMNAIDMDGVEGISREEYATLACDGVEDDEEVVPLAKSNLAPTVLPNWNHGPAQYSTTVAS